jgi:flagellar hook assembly protein FlgD
LQRVLTTATLVGLLVATAAAFAITERLKLVKSPIYGTRISTVFSPVCGCARGKAVISIKLRHGDRITVSILDRNLEPLRTLASGQRVPRGKSVFRWEGLTDFGDRAPEGTYRVQVHLEGQHRTILLPNLIRLDTTPPAIEDATHNREQFSPDGDTRSDSVSIHYVVSEPVRYVVAYVKGHRIVRTKSHKASGAFAWYGTIDGAVLPPGTYTIEVGAIDLAGNATPIKARARVRVELRYITLASHRIIGVRRDKTFAIGVSTDALSYTWKLGARRGTASGPLLKLVAPQQAGRYTLTVTEHGHSSAAAVLVK